MIAGELQNQCDRASGAFWSGGIYSPPEVIEPIIYLLFIRNLDDLNTVATVREEVFPFLQNLGGDGSTYGEPMKDVLFTIPTALLLFRAVDMFDDIPMADRDTTGELYGYLLAEIFSAGGSGPGNVAAHGGVDTQMAWV